MNDKRTTLAIFLCILVVMGWMELVVNPQARRASEAARAAKQQAALQENKTSSQGTATNSVAKSGADSISAATPKTGHIHPSAEQLAASAVTTVESEQKIITFTHLGARISHYKLRDYRATMDAPADLDMVHSEPGAALPLGVYVGDQNDDFVDYQLSDVSGATLSSPGNYKLSDNNHATFTFVGKLSNGQTIKKIIKIAPENFLFSVDVELPDASTSSDAEAAPIWIEWSTHVLNPEQEHRINAEQFTFLLETEKIKHIFPYEIKPGQIGQQEKRDAFWIAFNDKYFAAVLIPPVKTQNVIDGREGAIFLARARGESPHASFTLYVGPKDYKTLGKLGFQLERLIDLGWFSFFGYPLLWAIRFFYELLHNYGMAIIALTLVIKGLFLPLNQASFRSMQAMQDIAPEMKALRERVKDPTQLNQEMMALYKRRGVNPMGGCLPVLVQLPVFLGLYNALMNSIEMRHAPFALWIQDLSAPEHLMLFGVPVPVMVLIMGASMFVQQYLTPSANLDPMQRKMMLMMPVVFTVMFIVFPMPAGLVLYWLVSNIISITQQVYMRSDRRASPLTATLVASIAIFSFGYVLTLI